MSESTSEVLLKVRNLSIGIKNGGRIYPAVTDVSFELKKGEMFGLVGESGCGKSLTSLAIAGLLPQAAVITGGSITLGGVDLKSLRPDELRRIQGRDLSMIFQEPMTSLNPLMTIGRQVAENLQLHKSLKKAEIKARTIDILRKVGLPHPAHVYICYPHQLSGGMRQRVMIAMAIVCRPKLLIADEPTTALDVTIQAQILKLLQYINREFGTAILFISHDLGVINMLCKRTGVMYAGSLVEEGATEDIFLNPMHAYTKGLIGSIPERGKKGHPLANIPGSVPPVTELKEGCPFAPRCNMASKICYKSLPPYVSVGESHMARCILVGKGGAEIDEGL